MADAPLQNYKNHARFLPPFHFFAVPVLLINVLYALWKVWQTPSFDSGFNVLFAAALLMVGLLSRMQALSVQDRVIRLEMRLRLREVLPADLRARIDDLSVEQMVGLRFASDAEMPDLVRTVLKDQITKRDDIRKMVTTWVPDLVRA